MNALDPALAEFRSAKDEILSHLTFVESAQRLRPYLNGLLNWNDLNQEQKNIARAFMDAKIEGVVLMQGLFVRLMASFEAFMRRTIRDAVRSINDSQFSFDQLDEHLRNKNRHYAGRALASVFEPISYHETNFDELCKEVGTCVPNNDSVTLSSEAFSVALKGTAPDRLEAAFHSIGAKLNWDKLGGDNEIRAMLSESKTNPTVKALRKALEEMQAHRNGFAHTALGGVVVTADHLRTHCTLLLQVANLLKKQVEGYLETLGVA